MKTRAGTIQENKVLSQWLSICPGTGRQPPLLGDERDIVDLHRGEGMRSLAKLLEFRDLFLRSPSNPAVVSARDGRFKTEVDHFAASRAP